MKPGDLVCLKDGCGSSSYTSVETFTPLPNGPYFPPEQPALIIKVQENEPPSGCSKSLLLLGSNGMGWLPKHLLEVFHETG